MRKELEKAIADLDALSHHEPEERKRWIRLTCCEEPYAALCLEAAAELLSSVRASHAEHLELTERRLELKAATAERVTRERDAARSAYDEAVDNWQKAYDESREQLKKQRDEVRKELHTRTLQRDEAIAKHDAARSLLENSRAVANDLRQELAEERQQLAARTSERDAARSVAALKSFAESADDEATKATGAFARATADAVGRSHWSIEDHSELKPAINALVWRFLDGGRSLDEADELACEIYQLFEVS